MMRRPSGTDFLGLSNTLRSLTASPMTAAINEAHNMARRRLEAGGAAVAVPPTSRAASHGDSREFVLPPDVDTGEVAKAIEAKLGARRGGSTNAPPLLVRRAGGRVAVSGYHILRLGDGRFDLGRRFMHGLMRQIRASGYG